MSTRTLGPEWEVDCDVPHIGWVENKALFVRVWKPLGPEGGWIVMSHILVRKENKTLLVRTQNVET